MKTFYCNNCDENIELENGKCPICHCDWSKEVDLETKESSSKPNKNKPVKERIIETEIEEGDGEFIIDDEEIEGNVEFFLITAIIGTVIIALAGIISIIIGLVNEEGYLIVAGIALLLYAPVFKSNLQWKSYMLYTNHMKNKK